MTVVPIKIFPELKGSTWAEVGMDALARKEFTGRSNPLIDPQQCDEWVLDLAKRQGVDYTYGGYLEDRSHLWRGHYLGPGTQLHLGVDYNVPVGTKVIILSDAEIVHMGYDSSFGGWGGVIVFRFDKAPYPGADYLFYGHLAWDDTVALRQKVKAGELVGHIGKPHENGMWFPHLHVQMVSEAEMSKYKGGNPEAVDGYRQPPVQQADFPDPHPYVIGAF